MTAFWSVGFRPFFLGGALFAAIEVPYWVLVFFGYGAAPPPLSPVAWHAHEMLYGYLAAIVAGFLLTAMPNWTGRPPVRGAPLAALFALWLAGRVAIAEGRHFDLTLIAVLDSSFLFALAGTLAVSVIKSRSWRNSPPVAIVTLLACGNVLFYVKQADQPGTNAGIVIGISVAILLIMLIGGRIIPAFTRNWLTGHNPGRMPIPYNGFDRATLGISVIALAAWCLAPRGLPTAVMLALAAIGHCIRLSRWAGDRTLREPLLAILHLGYAFVPVGFALMAAASLSPAIGETAAIHAWTAGAIGIMTIAMMSRVTLGHTGNALVADGVTRAMYAAIVVAAALRICAGVVPAEAMHLLPAAALGWMAAMLIFIVRYGPLLVRRRA
jgi:uncharacterized protein involved in response to NO